MRVGNFEDLDVYREAFELQQAIFALARSWPRNEQYALIDQVCRSSRSIGANIAEAWAKRRYEAHFVSKLTDADGEQNETRHWLKTALSCGYLKETDWRTLEDRCRKVGAMLGSMMATSSTWVKRPDRADS